MSQFQGQRVRRGLQHFLAGKVVSAGLGVAAMLWVVRGLDVPAFAAYSVLVALVEVVTALTGLGISHVILRYVPELYASGQHAAERALVRQATVLRFAVLLAALALCAWQHEALARALELGTWQREFRLFLLLLCVRVTLHFVSQCLESTLRQRAVQTASVAGALVRLTLLVIWPLDLWTVIWIEVISDTVALVPQLLTLVRSGTAGRDAEEGSRWLAQNRPRLARYAWSGYLQHLAVLPYGGHANRLMASRMLDVPGLASYGFAQTLYEYAKRYLPAQLLIGLIRPIVISRYADRREFRAAADLCENTLQVNLVMVAGLLVLLIGGGQGLLAGLSGGRYGAEVLPVVSALALVLVLETVRQQLELQVQVVERYELLVASNALLSSSVLFGAVLTMVAGPVGIPLGNCLGLLLGNRRVSAHLARLGYQWRHDWGAFLTTGGVCALAAGLGWLARREGMHWALAAGLSVTFYAAAIVLLRWQALRAFYLDLVRPRPQVPRPQDLPFPAPALAGAPPLRIGFGVLSCRAESGRCVGELAQRLQPHPVWVHHDFAQSPQFDCVADNVRVLGSPVRTAWGDWSLVEATHRLMAQALEDPEVAYFVLLSEACLPVRPVSELADYLQREQPFALMSWVPLQGQAAVSHGWRYFQTHRLARRLLRRCSVLAWGKQIQHNQVANINISTAGAAPTWSGRGATAALGLFGANYAQELARSGLVQPAVGSQWLAVSRSAMQWLLQVRRDMPELVARFQAGHIPDEHYFQTLLASAATQWPELRLLPSLHAVSWRGAGTGPDLLDVDEATRLSRTGAFFVRKFAFDSTNPARASALGAIPASAGPTSAVP